MPIPWVVRSAGVLVIAAAAALGQGFQDSGDGKLLSPHLAPSTGLNAIGGVAGITAIYTRPVLLGVYGPDGVFRKTSGAVASQPLEARGLRPVEVPPWVDLRSIERVIEDFEPPAHATNTLRRHSLLAGFRDRAAALAYGRERVLLSPTHVTTDSQQRLIISDPDIPAVHVLDAKGKNSFRIAGGPQHRLRMPNGVATDAADNIYVADRERGMILVYDPEGFFLRYIGKFKDESMFAAPSGIAIDRKTGHLFVLDSPMNELIVLDLEGNVLQRVGRGHTANVRFHLPTEIALGNNELLILDGPGARVQVFDLNCNFLRSFAIANQGGPPVVREMGLSVDSRSNIYISNLNGSAVWIYDRDGHLIGGGVGSRPEIAQFNGPGGVWIDSLDRVYVADTMNSRIQVFLASVESDRTQAVESAIRQSAQ